MKLRARWEPTGVTTRFSLCHPPGAVDGLDLDNRFPASVPGRAVFVKESKKKFLCVKCREGWVGLDKIYYGNRRVIGPTDFYNGFLSETRGPGRMSPMLQQTQKCFIPDEPD